MLTHAAFAEEFEKISRALWCVAAGVVGDRGAAEDIVQESAVVALERLEEFSPGTNFLAWMGQIVRLTALNEVRKRGRRRTFAADPGDLDQSARSRTDGTMGDASPEEMGVRSVTGSGELAVGQESFDDNLLKGLRALDETARACLLLKVVLEMPYDRISLALGIPQGTAMSHVHRSRASLRDWLSRRSDTRRRP